MSTRPRPQASKVAANTAKSRQNDKEGQEFRKEMHHLSPIWTRLANPVDTTEETVRVVQDVLSNSPPGQSKKLAMKAVNATSAAIGDVHKSGWTAATPTKRYTTDNIENTIGVLQASLEVLRRDSTSSNVERAALNVVGRLIAMAMHGCAMRMIPDIQRGIMRLYESSKSQEDNISTNIPLHLLPLPSKDTPIETETLLIASTYLSYSLQALLHLGTISPEWEDHLSALTNSITLRENGSLLSWTALSFSAEASKQLQPLCTSLLKVVELKGNNLRPSHSIMIKLFALQCVLTVSSSNDVSWVWKQARNIANSYAKLVSADDSTSFALLHAGLMACVEVVRSNKTLTILLKDPSFETLCQLWVQLAATAQDTDAVNYVENIPSKKQPLALSKPSKKSTEVISSMTTQLEQYIKSGDVERTRKQLSQICQTLEEQRASFNDTITSQKVVLIFKATERLRRHLRVVSGAESIQDLANEFQALFIVIAQTYVLLLKSENLENDNRVDIISAAVENWIVISKNRLRIAETQSYKPVLQDLVGACKMVDEEIKNTPKSRVADLQRCLAGAFWNLGSSVYQAGRWDHSIPFISRAVEIDQNLLESHWSSSESQTDTWNTFYHQMPRRSLLLAGSLVRLGDRKRAYDMYLATLRCSLTIQIDDFQRVCVECLGSIVFDKPEFLTIAEAIDKITYLGTNELLMGISISLESFCTSLQLSPLAKGVILERQIQSLEQGIWKQEKVAIVLDLLQSAKAVFATAHPVRAARLSIIQLEAVYFVQASWEETKNLGETAIQSIRNDAVDLKLDAPLTAFKRQYLSSLYLWMAIHAHSHKNDDEFHLNAKGAERVLLSSVSSQDTELDDKAVNQRDNTSMPKGKSNKTRATGASKSKGSVPAKRAPVKAKVETLATRSLPSRPDDAFTIDNPEGFWTLMEMTWNLYSALGLTRLKITSLSISLQILRTKTSEFERDMFARTLIDLAFECATLGKVKMATNLFTESLGVINTSSLRDSTKLLFLLRFAYSLARMGDADKSIELYTEACDLGANIDWDLQKSSHFERTQLRIQRFIYTALACTTYARIQIEKANFSAAFGGYMQALRIWNAAADAIQRLTPKQEPKTMERNPFDMDELASTLTNLQDEELGEKPAESHPFDPRSGPKGWNWVLAKGLFEVQIALANYNIHKGNPRGAEYFCDQARLLADKLHAPKIISNVMCLHANLLMLWKQPKESLELINTAERHCGGNFYSQKAEVFIQKAVYQEHAGDMAGAMDSLVAAEKLLLLYNESIDRILKVLPWTASMGAEAGEAENSIPLLALIILQQIWLLRDDEYVQLLEKLGKLGYTTISKAHEQFLRARLATHSALMRLGSQSSLNSLIESVIAMPMVVQGFVESSSKTRLDVLETLTIAERECSSAFHFLRTRGLVPHLRHCALMLVSSLALQTSLGNMVIGGPIMASSLLDCAASVTLPRELLECVEEKLKSVNEPSDLEWPGDHKAPERASTQAPPRKRELLSIFQETEAINNEKDAPRRYWKELRDRYRAQLLDAEPGPQIVDQLPENWVVVTICVSDTKENLVVTRSQPQQQTVLLSVPLKRANRNDIEELNESLSFDSAVTELENIIRSSSQNGKRAAEVARQSKSIRSEWWAERSALDEQLKVLLENIEFCWLGAFKTLLGPQFKLNEKALESIHTKVYNIFKKLARKADKRDNLPSRLHPAIINCITGLSSKSRDEEIEDLIYFILDQYQLSGHLVFLADIDIDEVVLEMRAALNDINKLVQQYTGPDQDEDQHIFLVLDKNLQGLPLESLPILRGRSVSRIPSMSFLIDRLELARISAKHPRPQEGAPYKVHGMPVDPSKVFYVLNPGGDLKNTEETFTPWLKSMKVVGWSGIIGRRPTEFELSSALDKHDLFIYFGHGGAEQYIRGSKIRSLLRCSSTMLWGCSSGAMNDAGEFDRTGTPYNYLLAGCPLIVANLWDVTDRDIDKFAQSVFNKLRLDPSSVKAKKQGKESRGTSAVRAIAESRDICKLKYLNGAAPVVYGIPFYL